MKIKIGTKTFWLEKDQGDLLLMSKEKNGPIAREFRIYEDGDWYKAINGNLNNKSQY